MTLAKQHSNHYIQKKSVNEKCEDCAEKIKERILKMKNRYGDEYWFEKVENNLYKLSGNLQYFRFGAKEGKIDTNDLSFVDPSGGPFIGLGDMIEGKKITKISSNKKGIFLQVDNDE